MSADIPLLPGSLVFKDDGAIEEAERLSGIPPGALIVVDRYFVGANAILADGKHALWALTPYYYTYAAVEQKYDELRTEFPSCAILWTHSTIDPAIPEQLAELEEFERRMAAERAESTQ